MRQSPLLYQKKSQPVHRDISPLNAPIQAEHNVRLPLGKRLLKRADTIYNALGTFGPQSLLGSIDANGDSPTSNGSDEDGSEIDAPFVSQMTETHLHAIKHSNANG